MDQLSELLGESPAIEMVRDKLRRLLERQRAGQRLPPVLIQGDTGTGKGLVARLLHRHGARSRGSFVDINCAAIPETLLEAEFFGTAPGAFTGADRRGRQGKLYLAEGGTLFLDEIGDMPLPLQSKLLRVLQEKEYEPVGSNEMIKSDERLIAATSTDLEAAIKRGDFRADLYYRLSVLPIEVPPLRERLDDLPALSEAILEELRSQHELEPDGMAMLEQHTWPGNIRELRNVLERAALLSDDLHLNADDMRTAIGTLVPHAGAAVVKKPANESQETYSEARERFDRELIQTRLAQCRGNVVLAARQLGLGRSTLYKKMAALGIAESH